MSAQRQHLIDRVKDGQAEIRVLPWSSGAHAAMSGAFTMFQFNAEADPSAVYLESLMGGRYLESDSELLRYRSVFDLLWKISTPIEEHCHEPHG